MGKVRRLLCGAVLALALAMPAVAQQAVTIVEVDTTVGTSSTQCVPKSDASTGVKKTLTLWNLHGTNTVYYAIAGTPVAAANTAGSFPIAPGTAHFWPYGSAPAQAINCISTGPSTLVSALVGE